MSTVPPCKYSPGIPNIPCKNSPTFPFIGNFLYPSNVNYGDSVYIIMQFNNDNYFLCSNGTYISSKETGDNQLYLQNVPWWGGGITNDGTQTNANPLRFIVLNPNEVKLGDSLFSLSGNVNNSDGFAFVTAIGGQFYWLCTSLFFDTNTLVPINGFFLITRDTKNPSNTTEILDIVFTYSDNSNLIYGFPVKISGSNTGSWYYTKPSSPPQGFTYAPECSNDSVDIIFIPAYDPSIMQMLCLNSFFIFQGLCGNETITQAGGNNYWGNTLENSSSYASIMTAYCSTMEQADPQCGCYLPQAYYSGLGDNAPECAYLPCMDFSPPTSGENSPYLSVEQQMFLGDCSVSCEGINPLNLSSYPNICSEPFTNCPNPFTTKPVNDNLSDLVKYLALPVFFIVLIIILIIVCLLLF